LGLAILPPLGSASDDTDGRRLEFDLLCDIQAVIQLNPEISDDALQLRMAEEELHCAQVAGLAVDWVQSTWEEIARAEVWNVGNQALTELFNGSVYRAGLVDRSSLDRSLLSHDPPRNSPLPNAHAFQNLGF
jgi:hypothetical protein